MPVLPRLLMLVACAPLLLPTGLCVCKAGERDGTSTRRQAEVAAASNPTVRTKHRCPHCRPAEKAEPQAASHAEVTQPAPTPADDSHPPGCPATIGAERFKWFEPPSQFTPALPLVDFETLLPVESARTAAPSPHTVANWPTSPPLYLSNCVFVI